jgi:hypothetical protein
MRPLLAAVLMILPGVAIAKAPAENPSSKEATSPKVAYKAYWLLELKPGERANYQRLLIVSQPLERLATLELPPRVHSATREGKTALPFDHWAFTFDTYGKDSLWSDPFSCVKKIGEYDQEAKTLVVDGIKSRVEECPLADVVELLENPLGKQPLHRMHHPLTGAEVTAKAFVMLLKEQIAAAAPTK